MKILVIDNNILPEFWGASDLVRYARSSVGAEVVVRRGPQSDLPASHRKFDRVLISGSITRAEFQAPWVVDLDQWVRNAVEAGVPILGICYGLQTLFRALGGNSAVRASSTPEYGWIQLTRTGPSRLLAELPDRFFSYSSHQDEVVPVVRDFLVTASSDRCGIQCAELKGKPVFGVQFHPEKALSEASLRKDSPFDGAKVFNAQVGASIFGRFLRGEF